MEDTKIPLLENKSEVDDITPNETENTPETIEQYMELKENEKVEKTPEELKEEKRLNRNAYYREYYKNNKSKYNKHGLGRKRGQRGMAKKDTYKLSILDENSKEPIISQTFKSLVEIGKVLKVSPPIASMIFRGKYNGEGAKTKKTKRYNKFKIEKIR